jgi:hypothetical protein
MVKRHRLSSSSCLLFVPAQLQSLSSYHFSFLKLPTEISLLFPCALRFQTLGVLKRFNGAGAVAALSYLPVIFLLQYVHRSNQRPKPKSARPGQAVEFGGAGFSA